MSITKSRVMRSEAAVARWRELLARQGGEGLSVRAFCHRERISEWSFYHWRSRLGRPARSTEPRKGSISALSPRSSSVVPSSARFIDLGVLESEAAIRAAKVAPSREIRLELGDGIVLQVRRGSESS